MGIRCAGAAWATADASRALHHTPSRQSSEAAGTERLRRATSNLTIRKAGVSRPAKI
jgi:hypothetical protein